MLRVAVIISAVLACITAGSRAAAAEPKFVYSAKEPVNGVQWKASAQVGFILTTGNAETTTLSAGAKTSRKSGANKFALELGTVFARSTIAVIVDENANGVIDNASEIVEQTTTTAQAWSSKGRYDRFLTEYNSLYVSGVASADEPAGKKFVGGGQVGYSRLLLKRPNHELVAEAGYDVTYERPVAGAGVGIQSLRGFVGWQGKISGQTVAELSGEALSNVNALQAAGYPEGIDRFGDTRINGLAKIATLLFDDLSVAFSFNLAWDHAPSPRRALAFPFGPGFAPLAEPLDTRTEVSLVYNFL
jgi:hypothetical protein